MTSPAPVTQPCSSPISVPSPVMDVFPNRISPSTPPRFASLTRQCGPTFSTKLFDHERCTLPRVSMKSRSVSSPRKLQSSSQSLQGSIFVQSPSWLESLIDGASHNLRQRFYSLPQSSSPGTLRTSLDKLFASQASLSTDI